ncbi:MAG TPA: ATP-binding protein [Candidatus Saccharimonadia bacterium]|nr:ATP-binding protein [Candidatus Saccharimonadia bacterium]
MLVLSVILLSIVLAADIALGLVVWLQAPGRSVNRIFALLAFAFAGWSGSGFYDQTVANTANLSPFMAGTPFVAAILIAGFIMLFTLYFPANHLNAPRLRHGLIWALIFTAAPLIFMALFTRLIIAGVTMSAAVGNNIIVGPLYGLFPLFLLAWIGLALVNLAHKYRHAKSSLSRQQLSYVFAGFLLTTATAFMTNVIIPMATQTPTVARFGFLSTLFLIGFIGYAIVAHRLFNIRLLIARSVAYLLLLGTLTTLYGLGIFATSRYFFPDTGISMGEIAAFIAMALILAVTYQSFRRFFEHVTDRVFFRDHYNAQTLLDTIASTLASELLLEPLLRKSLKELCSPMHLAGAQVMVLERDRLYKQARYGLAAPNAVPPAEAVRSLQHPILIADELSPGALKDLLDVHGVRVSLMLRTHGEAVGFLFLGDKRSGDAYTDEDLAVLEIVRKELAVAITNARAYEEIAHFNTTLQERIRQATRRLSAANRNLKVLDQAKDDFISMASHQLGTPLATITGYLSMAVDEDKHNMTANQRQYISLALEASSRMVAMSSDLLNVSRLNSGRFAILPRPVDLGQLVEQEIEQLSPAAERKGLRLTHKLPQPPLPRLMLDESKTRQVVMNFIDNAIYYTPHGGIHVELKHEAGAVIFTVTDTGIGVPAAEQAKLFAKFYRADNARQTRPDGTGLGLYLAKKVIEGQNGTIIFASQEGAGSTFGFSLPYTPAKG